MQIKITKLIFIATIIIPFLCLADNSTYQSLKLGTIGITDNNLSKIPIGLAVNGITDSDSDGVDDELENALGTNSKLKDSDKDGYNDKIEITNNYNPLGKDKWAVDKNISKKHVGKLLLQVERKGQLWYINPSDFKRYFIKNETRFATLTKTTLPTTPSAPVNASSSRSADDTLKNAASAIRLGDLVLARSYFIPTMSASVTYSLDKLGAEGRFTFAGVLTSAVQTQKTDTEITYEAEVFFSLGDSKNKIIILVSKQADGQWLISKL